MRNFLTILSFCLLSGLASVALAQTPDGDPPAVEQDCIDETGAAFGLCNAYCEAMDCDCPTADNPDCEPNASQQACDRVKDRYQQKTGNLDLPCDTTEPPPEPATCPCGVDPDTFSTDVDWSDDPADIGFSSAGFLWNDGATGVIATRVPAPTCTDAGDMPQLWPVGDGVIMTQSSEGTATVITVRATDTGWECSATESIDGFPLTGGTLALADAAEASACRVDLLAGCP